MKKPKVPPDTEYTFRLSGEDWTLAIHTPGEKESLGGDMNHGKHLIRINRMYKGSEFRDYLLHELFEAASMIVGCSYSRSFPEEMSMFVMTHTDMNLVATIVRAAYDDVIEVVGKVAV